MWRLLKEVEHCEIIGATLEFSTELMPLKVLHKELLAPQVALRILLYCLLIENDRTNLTTGSTDLMETMIIEELTHHVLAPMISQGITMPDGVFHRLREVAELILVPLTTPSSGT